MSVLLFLIPAGHDWRVTLGLVFLFGVVDLVAVINVINFRQEETPEDMQGRVNTTGPDARPGGSAAPWARCSAAWSRSGTARRPGMYVGAVVLGLGITAAWFSSLRRVPARRPAAAVAL